VAKWLGRYQLQPTRTSLLERSRAPKRCPHKTPPEIEHLVLAQRRRTPGFGAERLKREFELPCGVSAIKRILRQRGLTRRPRRRHQRKRDLRAVKAAYKPFTQFQMDVKFLTDIPYYWPQMQRHSLPKFQYSIRELSCGAQFLAYADEVSVTYAELAARRLLEHLQRHGIDPRTVLIQSDNGPEFDGTARHKHDRGFVHTIEAMFGATHRFIPPGCKNAQADVETVHSSIETEFYDIEAFADRRDFLQKATAYQLWYNVARKNSSRDWKSPLDLLEQKAPELDAAILLLHPVDLGRLWLSQNSRHPPVAHHVPVRPGFFPISARVGLMDPSGRSREAEHVFHRLTCVWFLCSLAPMSYADTRARVLFGTGSGSRVSVHGARAGVRI
jgi:transposase InsO family protein